ncbi:MAG: hypothetical protein KAR42_09775 [candidate division Zixibacteria bacterium]|nr:hypothetical protein [candidate division Zixibacteria bacterium]
MSIRIFVLTAVMALIMLNHSPVSATGLSNARAIGMAGAYTSLARGYDAPAFNPANLGLNSIKASGLQLFGIGVAISNNSFSLDDYNKYTGATLSEQDKTDLLGKIPIEGLKVSADADVSVMAFSMGNFAFSVTGFGAAEININREVVELLLKGNTIADTVRIDGTYGEGYGLASVNASYGHRLYNNGDRHLAVGGTFRFLKGFGYEEITHLNGEAVTMATGFEGVGSIISKTATGGSGFSVDLGGVLQLNKSYAVGMTVFNFLSNISWNKETQEHHYQFDFDTLNAGNMSNDDIINSTDTTIDIDNFSTRLPARIKVGLAKTTGTLLWAVDWEQGFKKAAGSSSKPRISAGCEYKLFRFLPLRAGFGLGGKRGSTFSGGFGLDVSIAYLDFAVANYNAISGASGKGLNFGFNAGFRF